MNILTFDIEEWFHLLDHPETRNEHKWLGFESRFEGNLEDWLVLSPRIHMMENPMMMMNRLLFHNPK
mgnify:CR=1 FL=1